MHGIFPMESWEIVLCVRLAMGLFFNARSRRSTQATADLSNLMLNIINRRQVALSPATTSISCNDLIYNQQALQKSCFTENLPILMGANAHVVEMLRTCD